MTLIRSRRVHAPAVTASCAHGVACVDVRGAHV
jgi:hypothetical protein